MLLPLVVATVAMIYGLTESTLTIAISVTGGVLVALITANKALSGSRIQAAVASREVALKEVQVNVSIYTDTIDRQKVRIDEQEHLIMKQGAEIETANGKIDALTAEVQRLRIELAEVKGHGT